MTKQIPMIIPSGYYDKLGVTTIRTPTAIERILNGPPIKINNPLYQSPLDRFLPANDASIYRYHVADSGGPIQYTKGPRGGDDPFSAWHNIQSVLGMSDSYSPDSSRAMSGPTTRNVPTIDIRAGYGGLPPSMEGYPSNWVRDSYPQQPPDTFGATPAQLAAIRDTSGVPTSHTAIATNEQLTGTPSPYLAFAPSAPGGVNWSTLAPDGVRPDGTIGGPQTGITPTPANIQVRGGAIAPRVPVPRQQQAVPQGPGANGRPGAGTIKNNPTKYGRTQQDRNDYANARQAFLASWGVT